jgi:cytochrome c-type biogenesis protein CcmH/NrfF
MDRLTITLWILLAVLILIGGYLWFAPNVIDWTVRI